MKTMLAIGRLTFGIAVSLVLATGAFGQPSGQAQSTPAVKQAVRQLDISVKPWTGDFDQMLERRAHPGAGALQPLPLFQRQGAGKGPRRRERPRLRALDQQEVREEARQAPAHRLHHPHHPRQAAPGGRTGPGRHRRGQPHRHRGASEDRGFRLAGCSARRERTGRHRTEIAGDRLHGRPRRQDRSRPQGIELLREPRGAQRALQEGRQARRETGARARRAGRRGHDGDAQRRSSGSRRRG